MSVGREAPEGGNGMLEYVIEMTNFDWADAHEQEYEEALEALDELKTEGLLEVA